MFEGLDWGPQDDIMQTLHQYLDRERRLKIDSHQRTFAGLEPLRKWGEEKLLSVLERPFLLDTVFFVLVLRNFEVLSCSLSLSLFCTHRVWPPERILVLSLACVIVEWSLLRKRSDTRCACFSVCLELLLLLSGKHWLHRVYFQGLEPAQRYSHKSWPKPGKPREGCFEFFCCIM